MSRRAASDVERDALRGEIIALTRRVPFLGHVSDLLDKTECQPPAFPT